MFAPLSTATRPWSRTPSRATHVFSPATRERAGRLHHRAGVVEDVLDRRAHFVVGHAHDFVDRLLDDRERPLADFAHRDAVGENADVVEPDAAAGGERLEHRVGFERLDANHLAPPA